MKKLLIIILIILPLLSNFSFGQYGIWTELHPTIKGNYPNNIFPNRWEFGMAQLTDKKVLIFGGSVEDKVYNIFGMTNDTWIYDYVENSWMQINTQNSPPPRDGFSIAQISDGKILLYGGYYYDYKVDTAAVLRDTWIFDFSDTNWHEMQIYPKPGKRTRHGMSKLSDGKVLLFGGSPNQTTFLNSTYIFNLDSLDWFYMKNDSIKPNTRSGFGISQLSEGKILIYGGWSNKYLNDTWIFDDKFYKWVQLNEVSLNTFQTKNPISMLTKDFLLMFGGGGGGMWDSSWVFDINQQIWIKQNFDVKPVGRYMHNMAQLANGKSLMFGGISNSGDGLQNDSWIFELDSNLIDVEEIPTNNSQFKATVNPYSELTLEFNAKGDNAEIEIFNLHGYCVHRESIAVQNGLNRRIIQVDDFPTGVYFVKLRAGWEVFVEKVIVH